MAGEEVLLAPTGGPTLLSHPLVVETILPFLLVFTLVFAILQKSKVLGEGKKQIDAIVALVIGILVISFAQATNIIVNLVPFLAVSVVIILIFLILVGSFHKDGDFLGTGMKTFMMIIVLIATVIAVMTVTDSWGYILDLFYRPNISGWIINGIFVAIIIAVIWVVLRSGGSGKKD